MQSDSGMAKFWARDAGPQLSTGEICDHTHEHLGTSDTAIIAVRRQLINSASALRGVPGEVSNPASYAVGSDAVLIPTGTSGLEATAERRKVLAGLNPDCS
jgi:phthalate 4,5-dioxygenase